MARCTDLTHPVSGGGSVAVVRGGALGDFVLTLPAIAALRAAHPGARLVVVGDPARAALAGAHDVVDADSADWSRLCAGARPPDLLRRFCGCRHLLAYVAASPPERACLAAALACLALVVTVADPRPPGGGRHAADHLFDPVRGGATSATATPVPRLEPWGGGGPRDRVVVHPGSGGTAKCWPAPRFAAVIGWLLQRHPVTILWGPAEEERAAETEPHLPTDVPRLRPASPLQLARELASARLFVGNDSGPGHLAAAVGTPTVSIFGPTDPVVWRPLGPRARIVRAPAGDLARLGVDEVRSAVSAALREEAP